jgi:hypothetical protein
MESDQTDNLSEDDIAAILHGKQDELAQLLAAIVAGAENIDVLIVQMLQSAPAQARELILQKVKEAMQAREEEKTRKIEQAKEIEKKQTLERQRRSFRQWLSWIIAEDTLARLKETFMMQPILEMKVKNIGAELARKGVLTGINPANRNDLGNLSASVQQQKDAGQQKER